MYLWPSYIEGQCVSMSELYKKSVCISSRVTSSVSVYLCPSYIKSQCASMADLYKECVSERVSVYLWSSYRKGQNVSMAELQRGPVCISSRVTSRASVYL